MRRGAGDVEPLGHFERGRLDAEPVPIVHRLRVAGAQDDGELVAGASDAEQPWAGRTAEPGALHDPGTRRGMSFGPRHRRRRQLRADRCHRVSTARQQLVQQVAQLGLLICVECGHQAVLGAARVAPWPRR